MSGAKTLVVTALPLASPSTAPAPRDARAEFVSFTLMQGGLCPPDVDCSGFEPAVGFAVDDVVALGGDRTGVVLGEVVDAAGDEQGGGEEGWGHGTFLVR